MTSFAPVPVTLLAGFLGSGKTTLLNRILREEHGRRVAVLVNDFGDVNIDRQLVVAETESTLELSNGCICCSIKGDLFSAVQELLKRPQPPEHLLVEMSGVSEPASVLAHFRVMERSWPLSLDGVIALVDAEQAFEPGDPHYLLWREQLARADVVILNKVDLVSDADRALLRRRIADYVPSARILEAVNAEVPLALVLGIAATDPALSVETSSTAQHGADFATTTYRSARRLSLEKLREAATELPAGVFRAKGIVYLDALPEHRGVLQVVGRRAALSRGEPWGSEQPHSVIVAIGSAAQFDAAAVKAAFQSAEQSGTQRVVARLKAPLSWLRKRS